jgi:hypothetical protein
MVLEMKGQKIEDSTGTTMCNVDPEWCQLGRKEKREIGGRGYFYFPSEGRKELGSATRKLRHREGCHPRLG